VPASECTTGEGFVQHRSGKRAAYGALVKKAATVAMDVSDVRLKDPRNFRIIGRDTARRDSRVKVNGSAHFGIDVRPMGVAYAAVLMAPTLGATVASVDDKRARTMPGVLGVADFSSALRQPGGAGAGVAVIAKTWWQARQAILALDVRWHDGPLAGVSNEEVFRQFAQALDNNEGFTYRSQGDMDAAKGAAKQVTAEYRAPYLAHATMEPVNCTAQVKDGKVTIWVSTQVPSIAVDAAARVAGVSNTDVTFHMALLGGGFGRRLEVDMVEQAVAIARQANGVPVQVIWTREDDIAHDVYRPAALARFSAALDKDGKLLAWESRSASAAIGHQYYPRALGLPGVGPDKTAPEGEFDFQYEIANHRVSHAIVDLDVPVGYWRSVGHSHNAFFKESFLDEVALAAGQDPVEYRRALLAQHPRHLAVLDAALQQAGTPADGHAFGVALHQSFGSIVAEVAEVSVEDKRIRVHRVVCAIDCGIVVNPNIVRQQMESAVVFGLSAALAGEITLKDGRAQQSNFNDYPVLRIGDAPEVETIIMPSAEPPEGVGEPGVPPLAPAVAQAVFKLTGQRLRSLPLRLA
jgi:isoquinoline 1-oxidoreductase beta subunit